MRRENTELLAPAGNMMSLHAAVQGGADAVYLGIDVFNARRGADNFTLETLREACDYAHLRGVKVYLTLNTVILPNEFNEVLEYSRQAYRAGVDAFIVQDIGLCSELARALPEADLHVSTQMNTHSKSALDALNHLGVKRVTLSRELSLEELEVLAQYAEKLGMEVEIFAHGALCVCYSGQCFMSSMVGGRSANRGLCAQVCRLPYTLHNTALRKTLSAEGEYLLSPKDLCTIDMLPSLLDAGVASLKIEGRMKSPEYVYTVTSRYRKALDQIYSDQNQQTLVSAEDRQALAEVFSRGFTQGYLRGERGNELMSYGRPNNRGVFVGRVASVSGENIVLTTETEIHLGDVLEFWTNKGHITHAVDSVARDKQGRITCKIKRALTRGDRVFRVRNAELVFVDDALLPAVPVKAEVNLQIGKPLSMHVVYHAQNEEDAGSRSVRVEGPLVEAARTKAVNAEEVYEHIDRLGSSPFTLEQLDINLDEGVGIGFSQLHKIRSRALEQLQEEILRDYHNRELHKTERANRKAVAKSSGCKVVAFATNPACARAAKRAGADSVYVPALNYKRGQGVIAGQLSETAESAGYPKQAIVALPVVDHEAMPGSREQIQGIDPWSYVKSGKPVLAENLGEAQRALELGALVELGSHIPLTNQESLRYVADCGVERVWLSPELSLTQIEELGAEHPVPLGIMVAGSHVLMTTEHCLLMSQGPCNEDCVSCLRRKSPHYLKDRKGYELPVITDALGRSQIYNAIDFDIVHMVPELIRAGLDAFMVDTTMMNVAETTKALTRACRARDIAIKSGDKVSKKEGATTGHIFRGVS